MLLPFYYPLCVLLVSKLKKWLSILEAIEEELVSDLIVYRYRHKEVKYDPLKAMLILASSAFPCEVAVIIVEISGVDVSLLTIRLRQKALPIPVFSKNEVNNLDKLFPGKPNKDGAQNDRDKYTSSITSLFFLF